MIPTRTLAVTLCSCAWSLGIAQDYPTKPIRLIAPVTLLASAPFLLARGVAPQEELKL